MKSGGGVFNILASGNSTTLDNYEYHTSIWEPNTKLNRRACYSFFRFFPPTLAQLITAQKGITQLLKNLLIVTVKKLRTMISVQPKPFKSDLNNIPQADLSLWLVASVPNLVSFQIVWIWYFQVLGDLVWCALYRRPLLVLLSSYPAAIRCEF